MAAAFLLSSVVEGTSPTVSVAEEAIINALVAAETMIGRDDHKVIAIPHDRLCEVMKKYGRH